MASLNETNATHYFTALLAARNKETIWDQYIELDGKLFDELGTYLTQRGFEKPGIQLTNPSGTYLFIPNPYQPSIIETETLHITPVENNNYELFIANRFIGNNLLLEYTDHYLVFDIVHKLSRHIKKGEGKAISLDFCGTKLTLSV